MDLHAIIPLAIAVCVAALTVALALTDAIQLRRTHRMMYHPGRDADRDSTSPYC